MRKIHLLSILVFLCMQSCQKSAMVTVQPERSEFALQAKAYFQSILDSGPVSNATRVINFRTRADKYPVWDSAFEVTVEGTKGLMVPVNYRKDLVFATNFSDHKHYRYSDFTRLFLYKDAASVWHSKVLIYEPDSSYSKVPGRKFSGLIVSEDWWGSFKGQYLLSEGNLYRGLASNADNPLARILPGTNNGTNPLVKPVTPGGIDSILNLPSIRPPRPIPIPGTPAVSTNPTVTQPSSPPSRPQTNGSPGSMIETCLYTVGMNYGMYRDTMYVYVWYEKTTCSYISGGGGGDIGDGPTPTDPNAPGSTPGGGNSPQNPDDSAHAAQNPVSVVLAPPTNKIANVQDYLKCFTSSSSADHTYKITVAVEEPIPGTRTAWAYDGDKQYYVNVGHTFLIFEEEYGGTHIVRNIGFYPSQTVLPRDRLTTTQGALNNDSNTPYNVGVTYTVNNTQFFQALGYASLGNNPGFSYDLNTMNCTTFAVSAAKQAGINLPMTIGSWGTDWVGGQGLNPGDLGEDLRYMTLPANATRKTSDNNYSHPNAGTCQ